MDLETVVDELYGLDPGEFTPTRDARAREARQGGDRDLAERVKALRKASSSAWVVNQLARHQSAELQQLLDLGAQMREAQATLAADQIRALGRQRHQVVAGVARHGRRLAGERGVTVSDAVEREVMDTLEAALADPAAGAAAGSGRLLRALSHSGLDRVDLDGAVAGPGAVPAHPSPAEGRAEDRTERKATEARAAAEAARAEADRAAERSEEARARLDQAVDAERRADRRAEAMRTEVERVKQDLDGAREAHREAMDAADEARRAVDRMKEQLDRAREAHRAAAEQARSHGKAAEPGG